MNEITIKTREQLEAYKANWLGDPCWDQIDKSVNAPAVWLAELRAFERRMNTQWAAADQLRLMNKAAELGCPGNTKLARYVLTLEYKLETLARQVDQLKSEV